MGPTSSNERKVLTTGAALRVVLEGTHAGHVAKHIPGLTVDVTGHGVNAAHGTLADGTDTANGALADGADTVDGTAADSTDTVGNTADDVRSASDDTAADTCGTLADVHDTPTEGLGGTEDLAEAVLAGGSLVLGRSIGVEGLRNSQL